LNDDDDDESSSAGSSTDIDDEEEPVRSFPDIYEDKIGIIYNIIAINLL
jgi:hypothetical protein